MTCDSFSSLYCACRTAHTQTHKSWRNRASFSILLIFAWALCHCLSLSYVYVCDAEAYGFEYYDIWLIKVHWISFDGEKQSHTAIEQFEHSNWETDENETNYEIGFDEFRRPFESPCCVSINIKGLRELFISDRYIYIYVLCTIAAFTKRLGDLCRQKRRRIWPNSPTYAHTHSTHTDICANPYKYNAEKYMHSFNINWNLVLIQRFATTMTTTTTMRDSIWLWCVLLPQPPSRQFKLCGNSRA